MKKIIYSLMAACALFTTTSCENGDKEFDDYEYQAVYFAQQSPVRTITLGDDENFSTDLDNEHKCEILVTLSGVWKNRSDRHVKIAVDNTLCDGLTFSNGEPVMPMPEEYYRLTSTDITIPKGDIFGRTTVELTDAFFADAKSLSVNYVIPVKIISTDVDTVLESKNFTLYALKYKNKTHGAWISHGTDELNTNGVETTVVREAEYLEKNEIRYLSTLGLNSSLYNVSTTVDIKKLNEKGEIVDDKLTLTCGLHLDLDGNDNCTVTTTTDGCTATGTGKWERQGAKKAWGDKDRDQFTLNYEIRFEYEEMGEPRYRILKANDILVMRDRQSIGLETFSYK